MSMYAYAMYTVHGSLANTDNGETTPINNIVQVREREGGRERGTKGEREGGGER